MGRKANLRRMHILSQHSRRRKKGWWPSNLVAFTTMSPIKRGTFQVSYIVRLLIPCQSFQGDHKEANFPSLAEIYVCHCIRTLTDCISSRNPKFLPRQRSIAYWVSIVWTSRSLHEFSRKLVRWQNDQSDRVARDWTKPLSNHSLNEDSHSDRAPLHADNFLNNSRSYENHEKCNTKDVRIKWKSWKM